MKASDRIQSDLILSQELGVKPVLFLRQYIEVEREFEFRVFVKSKNILGNLKVEKYLKTVFKINQL